MNEILLEYYQGRPKELINCEKYLREIITLIKKDHETPANIIRTRSVYRDCPANYKLCKELADFFNVTEINIWWREGMNNACTYKPASFIALKSHANFNAGKRTNVVMHISIYENLVYHSNLNEQELLAVILHEIGHNFYWCPLMMIKEVLVCATKPLSTIIKLLMRKPLLVVMNRIPDIIRVYIPFVYNIVSGLSNVKSQFKECVAGFKYISALIDILHSEVHIKPISLIVDDFVGYGDEKGADSMCSRYGYGPEQVSALKKMSQPENMIAHQITGSMGTVGAIYEDLSAVSLDLIAGLLFDPHPTSNQRAASLLSNLEKDLKRGEYPPEMKRDLENEIERMKKAYETVNDPRIQSDVAIKKCWYSVIDALTKGHSDIREIFNVYFDKFRF